MKKYIFVLVLIAGAHSNSIAAECVALSTTYSCFTGYYLSGTSCIRCPTIGKNANGVAVYGTTVDRNTGGITSCYAPAGTYQDITGTFTFTSNCSYVN